MREDGAGGQLDIQIQRVRGQPLDRTGCRSAVHCQSARVLLNDASGLEHAARTLSAGWEAEISLAADIIFPTWLLLQCFDRFGTESPHTRIELIESVLGGTNEALLHGQADLAISGQIPPGFMWDALMRLRFIPAAHPEEKVRDELAAGTLKPLLLREGGERFVELYLIFAERDYAGPGTLRLAEIIRESVAEACSRHAAAAPAPSQTLKRMQFANRVKTRHITDNYREA